MNALTLAVHEALQRRDQDGSLLDADILETEYSEQVGAEPTS